MDLPITVKNLTKTFRSSGGFSLFNCNHEKKATTALKNVSFRAAPGEILGIIGPNGAGKTTLLKIMATSIRQEKGIVRIQGLETGKEDIQIRKATGCIWSANRSFYWRLTGRQNLVFFAALYDVFDQNSINQLLEYFQVRMPDKRFDSYSEGTKQKIAIIRALVHKPRILLMDEPLKNLDLSSSERLKDIIKTQISSGQLRAAVFAGHDLEQMQQFCDRFLMLNEGLITAEGTMEQLRHISGVPRQDLKQIFTTLTGTGDNE